MLILFLETEIEVEVHFNNCATTDELLDGVLEQAATDDGDWKCGNSTTLLPNSDEDRGD